MQCNIRYNECSSTVNVKVLAVHLLKQQERIRELINSGRYDIKNDFTVVLQPFMEGIEVPMKVSVYICIFFSVKIKCK